MRAPVPDGYDRQGLKAVVTLVPGTWAGKAAWARADSPLSRALKTAECQVVPPFEWSHSNCHRARERAARRLADQLQRQIKENPGVRQWIVAHSHGGNIALHAMRHLSNCSADAPQVSTVTLATPFIHARRRAPSGVAPGWPVFLLALFAAVVIAWASTTLAGGPHWRDWPVFAFAALVTGNALLCIVGAGMHPGFLRRGGLKWLWKRIIVNPEGWTADVIGAVLHGKFIRPGYQSQLVSSVDSPQVEPEDVFVIRAAGDEASTSLAAGQFLGWISALLNPLLTNVWLWLGLLLTIRASLLVGILIHRTSLGFSVLNYLFMVPGLVAVAAVSVMLAAALPLGWDGPFLSLFASCSVEAAPPGQSTVLQLPFAGAETRGLAHSRLYRSEPVISEIVRRICGSTPTEAPAEPLGSLEAPTCPVGQPERP